MSVGSSKNQQKPGRVLPRELAYPQPGWIRGTDLFAEQARLQAEILYGIPVEFRMAQGLAAHAHGMRALDHVRV